MTRAEIRTFVRDGINAISPTIGYGSGLITYFDSNRSWTYPMAFHESVPDIATVNTELEGNSAPVDKWEITIHVSGKTSIDATPDDYDPIIDQCDLIAQKLVYKYRNTIDGYKTITMTGISRTPFVKKFADCLAGVVLKFTLEGQDRTNVC